MDVTMQEWGWLPWVILALVLLRQWLVRPKAALPTPEELRAALREAQAAHEAEEADAAEGPADAPATAKHRLPVLAEPRCDLCSHWDHAEGQAIIRSNSAFAEVTQHVTPAKMGRKAVQLDENGEPDGPEYNPDIPMKLGWGDAGACYEHHELRFRIDKCDRFKRAADMEQAS